jgi:hypothetical protein
MHKASSRCRAFQHSQTVCDLVVIIARQSPHYNGHLTQIIKNT